MANKKRRKSKKKNRGIQLLGGILALLLAFGLYYLEDSGKLDGLLAGPEYAAMAQVREQPLRVHFLDVGQGDCILVQTDSGAVLIDAGEQPQAKAIIAYLREQKVEKLDYVIATHPHADHIGGMAELLEAIPAEHIIMPRLGKQNTPTTKTYETLLKTIQTKKINAIAAKTGSSYTLGEAGFTVYAPDTQSEELNNMSIATRFSYGNTAFLFTGDAEQDRENELLESGAALQADVFKAGHHGSKTSSCAQLLARVKPKTVVISCGQGNSYGHPHDAALQRFADIGAAVLRTDICGTIVMGSDGNKIFTYYENEDNS